MENWTLWLEIVLFLICWLHGTFGLRQALATGMKKFRLSTMISSSGILRGTLTKTKNGSSLTRKVVLLP
jgi:hypothetical protein